MPQETLDLLDKRVRLLGACVKGSADFVRKNLLPVKYTGSAKCADLSKLVEDGPGDYVFGGSSLPPDVEEGVGFLLQILRLVKSLTCDVTDAQAPAALALRKDQITELVCRYERHFPRTEVCRISHVLLHVCDVVHRWNNVRNYWCFLTERYGSKLPITVVYGYVRLFTVVHGYTRLCACISVYNRKYPWFVYITVYNCV